jgi:hypothetical protein
MTDEQLAEWERLAQRGYRNAWFLEDAQEAIPALIAEVRRLQAELELTRRWMGNDTRALLDAARAKGEA